MNNTGKPKKHRHKRNYTFMIISGDSDGSSGSIHLGSAATQIAAFVIFAVIVALICFVINTTITISSLKTQNAKQASDILELEDENATLAASNSELQSEVTQLSSALNQKVEAEAQTQAEEEEQSLPTLVPISNGTASMTNTFDDPDSTEIDLPDETAKEADEEDEDAADEDTESEESEDTEEEVKGNPILILKTEKGATVIASGAGEVVSVTADIKYGNVITIDHGNGYTTIYRNEGEALVHEGDTVVKGATLIVIDEDNTTLGFQIKSGEEFIDPEEMIEING